MMAGVLATSVALGRDYYVSPTGSDANPGTLDLPLAGDTVNVREGTYRETVTPTDGGAKSPCA